MLFFYQPEVTNNRPYLEDEEYQHCIKVLRKKEGDEIGILDGKGNAFNTRITEISGKQCRFEILSQQEIPAKEFHHHLAIAPTKSMDRVEWLVEKACELGVDEISFIHTQNSERSKLRIDRLEKKAISALKQSKSGYLTKINPLVKFKEIIKSNHTDIKLLAIVETGLPYMAHQLRESCRIMTLIGPEGDFATEEIKQASESGFIKISLGNNTLRTETAGIIAAQMVNSANSY